MKVFLQASWKYIVTFLLGVVLTLLLTHKTADNTQESQKEITRLKEEIAFKEGQNALLNVERDKNKEVIKKLYIERETLITEIQESDEKLIILDGKYRDIAKINNLSDKELYEFFKKINKK
jgi:23S rRNA A2030 N6-methylase RlmJ